MKTESVSVAKFPIRLGQFLKHACIVSDGYEGKILITNGQVSVNGVPENRRGRQLFAGDTILVGDILYECTAIIQ